MTTRGTAPPRRSGRIAPLALSLLLLAGCVTAPQYKDPLAVAPPPPTTGPFARLSVRVLFSENTEAAFRHMDQAKGARMGMDAGELESRNVVNALTEVLRARFRNVAVGPVRAGEPRGDVSLTFDARITVGSMSFQTNSVDLTGIFRDDGEQVIDTVTGKGESMVPYPNFWPNFDKAQKTAFEEFAKNLDNAAKLGAWVSSRPTLAAGRRPVPGPVDPEALRARVRKLGGRSWALVVGINAYANADPLNYAVADARAVADALPTLGFHEVRILLDRDATKANIERAIYGDLRGKMGPDDRLFVFFAGHGITVSLPRGGEEGYLIPVDGDPRQPEITAIAMDEIRKMGKRVAAKHIFFAIDSCFSGFALTRDIVAESVSDGEIASALEEPVIQVITAGRRGQKAIEEEGHGLFTRRLLDGLRGLADRDGRGFVTVTQLAAWLSPRVSRDSGGRQHPQYSALDGEGDFVFVLPAAPAK